MNKLDARQILEDLDVLFVGHGTDYKQFPGLTALWEHLRAGAETDDGPQLLKE